MKELCDWYIRRAKAIGVFYCLLPVLIWFVWLLLAVPFRPVYLLRLVLSLGIGCWVAAVLNDSGVRLWLIKHRSPQGPATASDGFLIGAAVGIGVVLLPPLTALIATNHPEEARVFIICSWLAGLAIGALNGAFLGTLGARHLDRMAGTAG